MSENTDETMFNDTVTEALQREHAMLVNKSWFFKKLAIPCLIYSAVFAFCMYRNINGVTTPIWVAALAGLIIYVVISCNKTVAKGSRFVMAIMLLIGISNFLTTNQVVNLFNLIAEFMLCIHLVLINFADASGWDFGKHLGEMIKAVFLSIGFITAPFSEASAYVKVEKSSNAEKKGTGKLVLIGIIITIPCIIALGALLGSADMVFGNMLDRLLKNVFIFDNFFGIAFFVVFGFFSAYCGLHYAKSAGSLIRVEEHRSGEPVIAVTIMSAISILYLVFSVIQILYLFIGGFSLPDGVTYAEYARTGFFQLMFVCVLNVIIVLLMKKYIKRNKVLDLLLIIVCGCTYIMVASSACRMIMYVQAYELTLLRVIVLVVLLAVAVLMVGVVISIINEKFGFFRFALNVICVIYTAFAFSKADAFIAKYNLENSSNKSDFEYISELSPDAAPAIYDYLSKTGKPQSTWEDEYPWYGRYCRMVKSETSGRNSIRQFNVAAYKAKKVLEGNQR